MLEIERKFMLSMPLDDILRCKQYDIETISQCYFQNTGNWAIRVRCQEMYETAYCMTLKQHLSGFTSQEIEFSISEDVYNECVASNPVMTKKRYHLAGSYPIWTIDVFLDDIMGGLMMAEIELPSENYPLQLPEWVGTEVTNIKEYRNYYLYEKLK